MDDLTLKEILLKKPFFKIMPGKNVAVHPTSNTKGVYEPEDKLIKEIVTQSDFIRQYHPSSHAINDPKVFPDIMKKDPETGRWYIQPVTRYSFAFQEVIATKQIVHIVGNDVQFELEDSEKGEENEKLLTTFRTGWLEKDMEIKLYEAVRSIKITGDAAIVGYFDKDKVFRTKTLSFLNDEEKLYPHFDRVTGELDLFARRYYDYDEEGNAVTEWVEVWDDKYLYRCKKGVANDGKLFVKIKEFFGLNGYKLDGEPQKHGFDFIPVAYYRDPVGACWTASQSCIENYEEAFSYLAESNKSFALPIMYFKGDGIDIHGDMNGSVKSISMPDDAEAGFLNRQDVSDAYSKQLNDLYKLIYELSFAVQPPELKSGDLPGVALKLLYSPAIEKAIHDCHQLCPFLQKLVKIVKYGYGKEINTPASMVNLKVNAWLEPYVHQNETEIITNLAAAVQNRFLSRQTASERCPRYPKNDEIDRIIREKKEDEQMDLLTTLRSRTPSAEPAVATEK